MKKWLSIYDSIFGPKLRSTTRRLKCSECEVIGILVTLWLWGMEHADRNGKIEYSDKEEIARYIEYRNYRSQVKPEDAVESFISEGWIDERDGELFFHDWEDWQSVWYDFVERQKKESKRQREQYLKRKAVEASEKKDQEPQPEHAEHTEQITFEPDAKPNKAQKKAEYGKDFEQFWEVYPRKVGKAAAYDKYCARVKSGYSPEEIIKAATRYAADCAKNHTEQTYIKHPETFLGPSTPFVDWLPKDDAQKAASSTTTGNPFEKFRRA